MTQKVRADAHGVLQLGPDVLGSATPHQEFVIERTGDSILVRPASEPRFWATATPQERASAFLAWVASQEPGPGLPDEALRREHLYATLTPQERAKAFLAWVGSQEPGPGLPDEALRREHMYDE